MVPLIAISTRNNRRETSRESRVPNPPVSQNPKRDDSRSTFVRWLEPRKRRKRKDKGTRLTVELQRCALLKPAIVLGGSWQATKNRPRNPWFQREIKDPSCARHSQNWQRKARNCYPREVDLRGKKREWKRKGRGKKAREIRWRRKWIGFLSVFGRGFWGISNPEIRVIAAGFRSNAVEAILVHESPRRGDLVIHAGRLRDGLPNDLDSGEILALRVGGTYTLPQLQMSATGRLSSGGANRSCNWILDTVKRCRELDRHGSLQSSFFFLNYLRNVIFKFIKIKQRNWEAKTVPNFLQMFAKWSSLKINRCRDKGIENV